MTVLPDGYTIRPSQASDLPALPGIEEAASALFEGMDLAPSVFDDSTSLEDFEEAHEDAHLFVAAGPDGSPVGFAFVEIVGDAFHLDELDVHPDHGRRGLGAALVETVCEEARTRGYRCVTLTTFTDVAWNAPFYARLGFEPVPPEDLTPELAALFHAEAERGLSPDQRTVMRREV